MRLGIVTPVVTRLPRAHSRWEVDAGIKEIARIATEAERLGYDHLTCSEHIAVPNSVVATRGATYWDPLATLGFIAGCTRTIRLATFVLVLGYHHPLEIVKRYGTLDAISEGRVILGVGVGSLVEEFELLGASFSDRGKRADDALRALRASWGKSVPEYHGEYFDYSDMTIDPVATSTTAPIWIGGQSARSLARAVEFGEAWAPFGLKPNEVSQLLAAAESSASWSQRTKPLEVFLQPTPPLDPVGDPEATRRTLNEWIAGGATGLTLRFVHHSLDHYCEQLEALPTLLTR